MIIEAMELLWLAPIFERFSFEHILIIRKLIPNRDTNNAGYLMLFVR